METIAAPASSRASIIYWGRRRTEEGVGAGCQAGQQPTRLAIRAGSPGNGGGRSSLGRSFHLV